MTTQATSSAEEIATAPAATASVGTDADGAEFPGTFSKYLRKGKESRGASATSSYKFGDLTLGLVATNLERGKSSRGASAGDPYKFGDFTRGIVGYLFDGSSSSSKSRQEAARKTPTGGNRSQSAITGDLRSIRDEYIVDKYSQKIGEGSFGYVVKGRLKATNEERAVKVLFKLGLTDLVVLKREVTMLRELDHPNILHFFDAFEDHCNVYLVMELCSGGELFDLVQLQHTFPEAQASVVMDQLMRAVQYMHSHNVCHRDLKPENFLLSKRGPVTSNTLKVIDFGFARRFEPGKFMKSLLGTAEYVAPEVLAKNYTAQCDIWSAGVILYILLCGYPPFRGKSCRETFRLVRQGVPRFNPSHWGHISAEGSELVRKMLTKDPRQRFTADQVLQHVWLKAAAASGENGTAASSEATATSPTNHKEANPTGPADTADWLSRFRMFQAQQTVVKTALRLIAPHVEQAEVQRLREAFAQLDKDGTGELPISQICEGLRNSGIKDIPEYLSALMNDVGSENNGSINYTEFLEAMLIKQAYIREHLRWEAFRVCDKDGDGRISVADLAAVINSGDLEEMPGLDLQHIKSVMESMGQVDAEGGIDFAEFSTMVRSMSERSR